MIATQSDAPSRRPFDSHKLNNCALLMLMLHLGCVDDEYVPVPASWTETGPEAVGDGCNPLAREWDCLLPYPCDFFLRPASTPSGYLVTIPSSAKPTARNGEAFDPTASWPLDGFPITQQIAVRIAEGVDASALAFHDGDIDLTLTNNSPTLVVEAATGILIPHFAELDPRPAKSENRALIIRPLVRLETGRRYTVILHKLKHPDGRMVDAPQGFKALRDKGDAPGIDARLHKYYDTWVWPVLNKIGVARSQTQLVWDFTTAFKQTAQRDIVDMLKVMRSSALLKSPKIKIIDVSTGAKDGGPWKIQGTVELPWFLDKEGAGGRLVRDSSGRVTARKTAQPVRYAVYIPKSAFGATSPARVVITGHGFFSDATELQREEYAKLFEHMGAIGLGVDWLGLAKQDLNQVLGDILKDLNAAPMLVDRLQQALTNASALVELVRSKHLAQLLAIGSGIVKLSNKARPLYYGASLGHILGSTLVALNPAISRTALQAGGAGFGMIMPRSYPFGGLLKLIDTRMSSKLGSLKVMLLLQIALARIEPLLVARDMVAGSPQFGDTKRPVLMQVGIGDASVPTLAAQLHARALNLGHDQPAPRKVWGLAAFDQNLHDSMYVEVDMGVTEPAVKAIPPTGPNEVHEGIRRLVAIREQIDAFLRPAGKLTHTCSGPCDKGD